MEATASVGTLFEALEPPPPPPLSDDGKPALPGRCGLIFEAERYLGGGAYGEVWLARHRATGERVALKFPRTEVVEADVVRRFLNEARVTSQLIHPNIVRVRAHGIEAGTPWIAYEYLGEETVHRRMTREGRLTPQVVLRIGAQVAGALEAAHARGVIHRDLKPANIIEVRPGEYKVLDFGLAYGRRPYAMQTAANIIVGTPAYLAPEQIKGDNASASSDQFGLGLVLYQLLTGEIPQNHDDVPTLLRRRGRDPIPSVATQRAGLPDRLVQVVDRMLLPDPKLRYASLASARRALEAALRAILNPTKTPRALQRVSPLAVRPVGSGTRNKRQHRRGGSLAHFLLAPLMVILAALICWMRTR